MLPTNFWKNIIWLHTKYDYDYFNEFVLLSPNITVQNIISEKIYVSVFLERKKETIIETSKQKKRLLSIINIVHGVVCIIIKFQEACANLLKKNSDIQYFSFFGSKALDF